MIRSARLSFACLISLLTLTGCQDNSALYQELEQELEKVDGTFWNDEEEVGYILERCDLDQLSWERVFPLSQLGSVLLEGSTFSDSQVRFLLNCPRLTHVHCPFTNITDNGVSVFQDMSQLKTLDLSGCNITDACIPDLLRIKTLETLVIMETPITKDGAQELAQQFSVTWSYVPSEEVRQTLTELARDDITGELEPQDFTSRTTVNRYDFSLWGIDAETKREELEQLFSRFDLLSQSGELSVLVEASEFLPYLKAISKIDELHVALSFDGERLFDHDQLSHLAGTHITRLHLFVDELTPNHFEPLTKIKGLQELRLYNQTITPEIWSHILHCPDLALLNFVDCQFPDAEQFETAQHALQIRFGGPTLPEADLEKLLQDRAQPSKKAIAE